MANLVTESTKKFNREAVANFSTENARLIRRRLSVHRHQAPSLSQMQRVLQAALELGIVVLP